MSSGFTRVTTTVVLRGGGEEGRGEDVTYERRRPRRLPARAAARRAVDDRRLLEARRRASTCSRPAGRRGVPATLPALGVRERRARPGPAPGGPVAGRGARPRPTVRCASSSRPASTSRRGSPSARARVQARPDGRVGRARRWPASPRREGAGARLQGLLQGHPRRHRARPDALPGRGGRLPRRDPRGPGARRAGSRGAARRREARFSFDAPIHSWADVEDVARRADRPRCDVAGLPRHLNIKPSRFGSLGALLDCIARAQAAGITLYGGGQFELGVGRSRSRRWPVCSIPTAQRRGAVRIPRDGGATGRAGQPAGSARAASRLRLRLSAIGRPQCDRAPRRGRAPGALVSAREHPGA